MKKLTINDIAKSAGVSKATVSMVLNKKDKNISAETRNRILNVIKETGYIPNLAARSLNTNRTGTIGIIVPDITNPFFSQISRAIEDFANQLGYNVILCNSDNDIKKERSYTKLLISKQVEGVILIFGSNETINAEILKENMVPFVLVDRYIDGFEEEPGVFCDNRKGSRIGVEYLQSKNKRNIAFVTDISRQFVFEDRLEGYRQAMRDYGIYKEGFVFEENLSLRGGMDVTRRLLDALGEVDAIFYCSDLMALAGIKMLKRRNLRVPEDIAVMGYDNIQFSEFVEPELTTVAQPIYEMGKTACELLTKLINGEITEKHVIFTPKLIIRGTV